MAESYLWIRNGEAVEQYLVQRQDAASGGWLIHHNYIIPFRYTMRPALQRLLARPPSVELLRYMAGPVPEFCSRTKTLSIPTSRSCRRHNSSSAAEAVVPATSTVESPKAEQFGWEAPPAVPFVHGQALLDRTMKNTQTDTPTNTRPRNTTLNFGPWNEFSWTREEIELQSNLDAKEPRLLDQPEHKTDLRLWACLFAYRRRVHKEAGVRMFWEAAKRGDFQVPVLGDYVRLFWEEFVKLGLQDPEVLDGIVELSNQTLQSTGERWLGLYANIIEPLLLNGRGQDAVQLHNRLFKHHPPRPEAFAEMISRVILRQGDTDALKEIYVAGSHRNMYGMVVPYLCDVEDFESAYLWHWIFVDHGDLPMTFKTAEPLVHFLSIYYTRGRAKVTQSLVDAGVPFASRILELAHEKIQLSRELMNLMHGETYDHRPRGYDDDLGARWFATRWVSLDVAMTAISALGIENIGPISLQAIALRVRDADELHHRLDQLRDLKIGIGNSVYSKSLAKFAESRNQKFLDCLLDSDLHPDALEDPKFLERLLISYEMLNDNLRYQMTMDMILIRSSKPERDQKNLLLRQYAVTGDTGALLASLETMKQEGRKVTGPTVKAILRHTLRPRRRGHPPASHTGSGDDLMTAVNILKGLMQSGTFVPATYWGEIIKRLGMEGRFNDLEDLCVFLASWYGPANKYAPAGKRGEPAHRYRVPAVVTSRHPLHPLKILFPASLQRSIVEWGFQHGLRPRTRRSRSEGLIHNHNRSAPATCGILLLKKLYQYHTHIDIMTVRRAIFDRLIIYYGPGESKVQANRQARAFNSLSLEEMVEEINEALGVRMLNAHEAREIIEKRGIKRIHRCAHQEKLEEREFTQYKTLQRKRTGSIVLHGKPGKSARERELAAAGPPIFLVPSRSYD